MSISDWKWIYWYVNCLWHSLVSLVRGKIKNREKDFFNCPDASWNWLCISFALQWGNLFHFRFKKNENITFSTQTHTKFTHSKVFACTVLHERSIKLMDFPSEVHPLPFSTHSYVDGQAFSFLKSNIYLLLSLFICHWILQHQNTM